jgi:hypothetical protein
MAISWGSRAVASAAALVASAGRTHLSRDGLSALIGGFLDVAANRPAADAKLRCGNFQRDEGIAHWSRRQQWLLVLAKGVGDERLLVPLDVTPPIVQSAVDVNNRR